MTDPYVQQTGPQTPDPTNGDGSTADRVKTQGRQVAGDAAEGGKHVAQVAAGEASSVAREATDQARSLMDQASAQLSVHAADQKETLVSWLRALADELQSMAGATRSSSNGDGAQSSQAGVATGLAERGADYAHRTASWLSDREPSAVLEEVGAFARRRPGTFLVIAAAAGVLVGRLTRGLTAGTDDDGSAVRSTVTRTPRLPDVQRRPGRADVVVGAGERRPRRRRPAVHDTRGRLRRRRRSGERLSRGRSMSTESTFRPPPGDRPGERPGEAAGPDRSVGELIAAVSADFSTLMRQEVELAKAEVRESATRAGAGVGMLSGAGVAVHMVLLFLSIAAWWGIAQWIGHAWSGVVIAAVWGVVALILYASGRSRLRRVQGLSRTVETTKQIPDALAGKEDSR